MGDVSEKSVKSLLRPIDFCEEKAHNRNMKSDIRLAAEFGTAHVGAEVIEWDSYEHEDGYRERISYVIIPNDSVNVLLEWHEVTPQSFETMCDRLNAPEAVVRFTVSHPESFSFIASTWVRVSEGKSTVAKFVEDHK